jgi:hypothetical protein
MARRRRRQRSGLGLSPEAHRARRGLCASEARGYMKLAGRALRRGDCREALKNAAHALDAGSCADTHSRAGGFGVASELHHARKVHAMILDRCVR